MCDEGTVYDTVIRCRIRMLTTSEGGRRTPFKIGNLTAVKIGENAGDAQFGHRNGDVFVDPGQELEIDITLAHRSTFEGYIRTGERVEMVEGSRIVGEGVILTVLSNPDRTDDA